MIISFIKNNGGKCAAMFVMIIISALVTAFSGALYSYSITTSAALESNYTTMAIVDFVKQRFFDMDFEIQDTWVAWTGTSHLDEVLPRIEAAKQLARSSENVILIDDKRSLSAFSEGLVSAFEFNTVPNEGLLLHSSSDATASVMVGTITKADEWGNVEILIDKENSPSYPDVFNDYNIVEHVYMIPTWDGKSVFSTDGHSLYKIGDKYMFFFENMETCMPWNIDDPADHVLNQKNLLQIYPTASNTDYTGVEDMGYALSTDRTKLFIKFMAYDDNYYERIGIWKDMKTEFLDGVDITTPMMSYGASAAKYLPMVKLGEGGVEEVLNSEIGYIWKKWIELAEIARGTVTIYRVNNLNAVYPFNEKTAVITRGRQFTQSEYDGGEKVCLISETLAQKNGLNVNDSIPLSFFNNGYTLGNTIDGTQLNYTARGFSFARNEYEVPTSYKIVGIYRAHDETVENPFSLCVNTVFVPDKSLAKEYVAPPIPTVKSQGEETLNWDFNYLPERFGMLSIVLKNGTTESFASEMESAGLGGVFQYFDQGYSQVRKPIDEFNATVKAWLAVTAAVWVVVAALFFVIYSAAQRRSSGILRSLGYTKKRLFGYWTGTACLIGMIASAAAIPLALSVFENVKGAVLSEEYVNIAQSNNVGAQASVTGILIAVGVQFAAFAVMACLVGVVQSNKGVLTLIRGRKAR